MLPGPEEASNTLFKIGDDIRLAELTFPEFFLAECGVVLNPQFYAYISASQARVSPSTSYTPSRHKRSYEEDEDMEQHPSKQKEQHMGKGHY